MVYMLTFTINIPQMLAYIPYMDPMGIYIYSQYKQIASDDLTLRECEILAQRWMNYLIFRR